MLPQLALLLLGGHLDDSRLIYYPRCPVTFLHDTNDPSLVSLLLLNVLTVRGGLFPGQANEQAP